MIRLAAFQASGGTDMKLHETQDHFHEVPPAISEVRRQRSEARGQMSRLRSLSYDAAATAFVVVLVPRSP
jgi:hypothetical protein